MPGKIRFVLVEPRNPKNIGAAARGMANFGFRDLAVVKPFAPAWRETRSAVNAAPVVEKAKKYDSLKAALRSSHVVIGTSAGSRRSTDKRWIGPEELKKIVDGASAAGKSVAIVFGSERFGLSNEALEMCRHILTLPTDEACPSMNLSQAVAVVAYSIRRCQIHAPASTAPDEAVSVTHLEKLMERGLKAYAAAGLFKGWDPRRSRARLRKALTRWNLNEDDTALLHGLFSWVLKKTAAR